MTIENELYSVVEKAREYDELAIWNEYANLDCKGV